MRALRRESRLPVVLLAMLAAGACSNLRSDEAALAVTVEVSSGVKANCVGLFARTAAGVTHETEPAAIGGRDELKFAVYRTEDLTGTIFVGARGYLGADCAGPLNEESAPVEATFVEGTATAVRVKLEGVPATFDQDGDGWRAEEHGGSDCLDTHPQVYPGAPERCDDLLDNDCNGAADCAEATCAGLACSDGNLCTVGQICEAGACVGGMENTCDDSPGECFIAPGMCDSASGECNWIVNVGAKCATGHCADDGQCVDVTIEVNCADGLDDDENGLIDCADPDCDAKSCSDGNACTVGEMCAAKQCGGGVPKVCDSPRPCELAAGTCQPNGSCTYAPKPAGEACGAGMSCNSSGQCVTAESGVTCSNGLDDDQDGLTDCEDPSCNGSACDDKNACTTGEVCGGGTCGGGSTVTCTMPPACHESPGTCDPNTGCSYAPTPGAAGTPCAGGFCDSQNVCVPPFPYVPSNFNPLQFEPAKRGGPYLLDCGTTIFDSTPGTAQPFSNWCGGNPPVPQTITMAGGAEAVVLPLNGLTIKKDHRLNVIGTRPVILAVYGAVKIDGLLFAGAEGVIPGAGGSSGACGAGTGATGTTSGRGGGGGGGAFGTFGAAGGKGYNGTTSNNGGTVNGEVLLVPLRGGCAGGPGGNGGGPGGAGGGALQISASGTLTINKWVTVRGGGGRGATANSGGGGGGGSGGGLLLEGAQITLGSNAIVSATGGAGGEGKGPTGPDDYDGSDGRNGLYDTIGAATCPNLACRGGEGGSGSYVTGSTTIDATVGADGVLCLLETGGGGGGGGGSGRIRLNAGASGCSINSAARLSGVVTSSGSNCP